MYKGLPPGPICFPATATIDAVLNYEVHNYLYFCAKSDFSGYHSFSTTYTQHQLNARKYHDALNGRLEPPLHLHLPINASNQLFSVTTTIASNSSPMVISSLSLVLIFTSYFSLIHFSSLFLLHLHFLIIGQKNLIQ